VAGNNKKVLPLWYQALFLPQVTQLGVIYATGIATSLRLSLVLAESYPQASSWYLWTAVATAAHSVFTHWAWEGLKGFSDDKASPDRNEAALRGWLRVSLVRLVVTEIPAWLCAVLALRSILVQV